VSFEFFPPQTAAAQASLWSAIAELEPLAPRFVSVTYGAGGGTRERTRQTIERILTETSLTPAAHLTCVGATKSELDEVARAYWALGVRSIVALRGDPPGFGRADGVDARYEPYPGGYAFASDLVAGLRRIAPFDISVAVYPERHPESPTWQAEIDNLKRKADAGADRGITQFFFDVEVFLRFMDRVRGAGIGIAVAPGVMPVTNFAGLERMARSCGASVPAWLERLFEGLDDRAETRALVAATVASELCARLTAEGYREIHFYTLNRPALTRAICQVIGVRPRAAAAA
jgi:methylenetetrahydrofolate reductase (NADPH)